MMMMMIMDELQSCHKVSFTNHKNKSKAYLR